MLACERGGAGNINMPHPSPYPCPHKHRRLSRKPRSYMLDAFPSRQGKVKSVYIN